MIDSPSRRAYLQTLGLVTASSTALCSIPDTTSATDSATTTQDENTTVIYTNELPDIDMKTRDVSDTEFVVRYTKGYEDDAENIANLAQCQYEYLEGDLNTPLRDGEYVLELYPDDYYPLDHAQTGIETRDGQYVTWAVAPSEYAGHYDDHYATFYPHWINHGFGHILLDQLSDHAHHFKSDWVNEGFVEAYTVYNTLPSLEKQYTTNHETQTLIQAIKDGRGHLPYITSYTWDGGKLIFKYLFDTFGLEETAQIFTHDETDFYTALERELGLSPLQLQHNWLDYASGEYGGDYNDQLAALPSPDVTVNTTTTTPSSEQPTTEKKTENDDIGQGNETDTLLGGLGGFAVGSIGGYQLGKSANRTETND